MDRSEDVQGLSIDRERIRAAHEARLADWPRERKPLTIRASVRVEENHRKTATVGAFTVESDEGAIVGGEGTAPTPLSYFVSAVGFAVLTDLVRAFALHDLPADGMRLEIEAEFPLEAKYGGASTAAASAGVAASGVRYTVDVATDAPPEQVAAAIEWAEAACHAAQSLREPVPVEGRYRVNGRDVITTR